MDIRLIAIGIILLITSLSIFLYSLTVGMQSVAGVALSTSVLGGVITALGLTYRDPFGITLLLYSRSLNQILSKVYEDLGLLNKETLQTCKVEEGVMVIYTQKRISCNDVKSGIGLAGQIPYIAIHISGPTPEPSDPQEAIRELGLADIVHVYRSDSEIVVELVGIRREIVGEEWRPLNPIQILIAAYLTLTTGDNMVREGEEYSRGFYRARFRVVPR